MIDHRGRAFGDILNRVTDRLKYFFQTKNDVFLLTCSGTGGMEAAVVNTLSPGDRVLVISIGAFGDRFANIAETYGANVTRLNFEWGTAADPEEVRKALAADPAIKAVLVTHNETSTGVTNPLADIARVVREFDKLLLVDAVSSLGSIPFYTDDWGVDFAVTASQKGWMVPPGLAMVSVSQRAWDAYAQAKMPRFSLDVGKAKDYLERSQTPWTPPVSVVFALDYALEGLEREGLENIFARHQRIGELTRRGVKDAGAGAPGRRALRLQHRHRREDAGGRGGEGPAQPGARTSTTWCWPAARAASGQDLPHRAPGRRHRGRHPLLPGRAGQGAAAGGIRHPAGRSGS